MDFKSLEPTCYERVYNFVLIELAEKLQFHYLPELRQWDEEGIFFRFR